MAETTAGSEQIAMMLKQWAELKKEEKSYHKLVEVTSHQHNQ
jgi:hypothetical protein